MFRLLAANSARLEDVSMCTFKETIRACVITPLVIRDKISHALSQGSVFMLAVVGLICVNIAWAFRTAILAIIIAVKALFYRLGSVLFRCSV